MQDLSKMPLKPELPILEVFKVKVRKGVTRVQMGPVAKEVEARRKVREAIGASSSRAGAKV